jgi:chromosome segregation ATPase
MMRHLADAELDFSQQLKEARTATRQLQLQLTEQEAEHARTVSELREEANALIQENEDLEDVRKQLLETQAALVSQTEFTSRAAAAIAAAEETSQQTYDKLLEKESEQDEPELERAQRDAVEARASVSDAIVSAMEFERRQTDEQQISDLKHTLEDSQAREQNLSAVVSELRSACERSEAAVTQLLLDADRTQHQIAALETEHHRLEAVIADSETMLQVCRVFVSGGATI